MITSVNSKMIDIIANESIRSEGYNYPRDYYQSTLDWCCQSIVIDTLLHYICRE
jgi:hypothetical protein